MEKVIRDGKVAVLYSPGWGAGWYSWHGMEELLYHPTLVQMVEDGQRLDITNELCNSILGKGRRVVVMGEENLTIEWLPIGTEFIIDEYDGNESITLKGNTNWLTA